MDSTTCCGCWHRPRASVSMRFASLAARDHFEPIAWRNAALQPSPGQARWYELDVTTLGPPDGDYEYEYVLDGRSDEPVADPYATAITRFGGYRGVFAISGGQRVSPVASAPRSPSSTGPVTASATTTSQRPGRAPTAPWPAAGRHPGGVGGRLRVGWLVDLPGDLGLEPHLAHPARCTQVAAARLQERQGRRRDAGAAGCAPTRRPRPRSRPSRSGTCVGCPGHRASLARPTTSLQQPGPRGPGPTAASGWSSGGGARPGGRGWRRWTCPQPSARSSLPAAGCQTPLPGRSAGQGARSARPPGPTHAWRR